MRKCCVIADFLSEENKLAMRKAAEECGFGISFFESAEAARGMTRDAEVMYCADADLAGEAHCVKWWHTPFAGAAALAESGLFDAGKAVLTNSSGAYGLTISEHVIMVTLMLMRQMPYYLELVRERGWEQDMPVRSIDGSSMAIIGTGDIGQNAARRYRALGANRIAGFSRSGRPRDGFDAVYRIEEYEKVMSGEDFDVLLLCVPGTPESEGLLSADRISMLSEKTFVINVGRGIVIDQEALVAALNEGRIAGAALDVMYPEPLPADHPLYAAKNCIITPHVSGDMGLPHTVDITVDIFCDNLRRYTRGEELTHRVDIKAGY